MCGRFIVSYTYEDLLRLMQSSFNLFDLSPEIEVPRYNVCPGTNVAAIVSDGNNYRLGNLRWGFIPSFAKDETIGYKMINARVEGIVEKASFKESFQTKRCVILSDGYYEWKKIGNEKQPYLVQTPSKELFYFAGIWSKYVSIKGETIYSAAIITKEANEQVAMIHHRMPIILDEVAAKEWLDIGNKEIDSLLRILENTKDKGLSVKRVSTYVNSVKNDSSKCIEDFKEESIFEMDL